MNPAAAQQLDLRTEDDRFNLEILNAFAVAMLNAGDLDDLLWSIADNVGKILGFSDCVVYLREGDVMVQMAAYGVKTTSRREIFKRIKIPVGSGIVGTVALTGIAEFVPNTKADERYIFDQFSGLSELTVPVIYEGKTIAVIDSESPVINGFSNHDQDLLEVIANVAASRIASAMYYRTLQATQFSLERSNEALKERMSDLARNQQSLVQSEKMASVGLLAAGIAHEINNPLAFSLSNLTTLKEYIAEITAAFSEVVNNPELPVAAKDILTSDRLDYIVHDIVELTNETIEGLNTAKEIVSDLRLFARSEGDKYESANINEGLRTTLNVLRNELRQLVSIDTDFGDIPCIMCNIGKLNQVFANIILNASQACVERGQIKIRTSSESGRVIVEIRDNGNGISKEHIEDIFTPFYTTKTIGEGTGLGLFISYKIVVEEHKGKLEVDSNPEGTTFRIVLPIEQES